MRAGPGVVTAGVLILFSACGQPDGSSPASEMDLQAAVEVTLFPQSPDPTSGRSIRWSPYGKQLPLAEAGEGMEAFLPLGPTGTEPIRLLLGKSTGSDHFDLLHIDVNRDGEFDGTELHETEVSETRNKFWSSFDAVVGIPVTDPNTRGSAMNPYPLSLWYVEDPAEPEAEPVVRFSRRGWMEGEVVLDGIAAAVMVTESSMDGVIRADDSWALAPQDSASLLLEAAHSRSLEEHAWLFEKAYRVVEVDPSGRRLYIGTFDPGMTRAEEVEMNDHLAVDRRADRSGRNVAFLHEFEEAEALARREGKALFIDFETTWCGPCKVMDEWVYTADVVVDASRALVAVKVDGDERPDLKERFEVQGFPTMILLDRGGMELRRASGYVNVAAMTEFLKAAS